MFQSKKKKCDIIIPVWNQMKLTKECVESINRHTIFSYRIIFIDNASNKPAKQYLESLSKRDNSKFVILKNEKNVGFIKAVNRGMRFSDAGYVCIMNNDTVATPHWLSEMCDILERCPDIGIVNPSSNTFGQFPGDLGIDNFADSLKSFKGKFQELYTCRAFSMVIIRDVIKKIGFLDEGYEIGYFDDNDYSKRAQKAGYKTVRAKASYVYHKESRSFSKLKEKNDIFRANEKKFESKWGRRLRIGYIIPSINSEEEAFEISSNVNKIAQMQHEIWIFSARCNVEKCTFIDHDNIRFFYITKLFLTFIALIKILKRRKKKKVILILTNSKFTKDIFSILEVFTGAKIFPDDNILGIENEIYRLSQRNRTSE